VSNPVNDTQLDQALVVFTPSGRRARFPVGTPLLTAARSLGVDIDSVCGGRGICGRCKVVVAEGQFQKHGISSGAKSLSPLSEPEHLFSQKRGLKSGCRLSCHATLNGDAVIDVPAESQVHRQVIRKEAEDHDIRLNPLIRLFYVEVDEPDMNQPIGDMERLLDALSKQWELSGLTFDSTVLARLQPALRNGKRKLTVAIHDEQLVSAVWAGLKQQVYGVAIDIGSTTLAAHLTDLSSGEVIASTGMMNPQIRFGEDLMSRVSWVMMNPEACEELTDVVRAGVNELLADLTTTAGISLDDVLELTTVANPVMHHLFLGISPVELGTAPFTLAVDSALTLRAVDVGLRINPGARLYMLPCIAGYVGADTAAVILAEQPQQHEGVTLIVDVGTNAEIVLADHKRVLAASSPTGPAFEGAQISCGQRAAPGAIERVRIDRQTLAPRFKVIGCDQWSDEPGFAESIAKTGITGVCGSGIIEAVAQMYLTGVINADGVINDKLVAHIPWVNRQGRTCTYRLYQGDVSLCISQNDIRAIQLAKAALYAGIKLLMNRMGVTHVDRIRLAGAFGSHIDVKYAQVLGLIPDCDLNQVSSAGNAAGTGARIALLDKEARLDIETLVKRVEKIETALAEDFQAHFVNAMAIPHRVDPFTRLRDSVTMPAAGIETKKTTRRHRRRNVKR
jgi:uncharacterized 2Fe-2S/4Fe-4S cluster protein (DUF4445 family)